MELRYPRSDYDQCPLGSPKNSKTAGSGAIPADVAPVVHTQLLGLLLYATPQSLRGLLATFGGDDALPTDMLRVEEALPAPHPALRCLLRLDAGMESLQSGCLVLHLRLPEASSGRGLCFSCWLISDVAYAPSFMACHSGVFTSQPMEDTQAFTVGIT